MNYNNIEENIRTVLINNSDLKTLFGLTNLESRIRVGHISSVTNPEYPCITISITSGGIQHNQFSAKAHLHIDIWDKDTAIKSKSIYNTVENMLNLKQIDGIVQIIQKGYSDDLFEKNTRTYHISSWYEVTVIK